MKGPDERSLTVIAVARELGVSGSALRNWAARGLIAYTRTVCGHRRFARADVEALKRKLERLSRARAKADEIIAKAMTG